jgi:hypothetical protein
MDATTDFLMDIIVSTLISARVEVIGDGNTFRVSDEDNEMILVVEDELVTVLSHSKDEKQALLRTELSMGQALALIEREFPYIKPVEPFMQRMARYIGNKI